MQAKCGTPFLATPRELCGTPFLATTRQVLYIKDYDTIGYL